MKMTDVVFNSRPDWTNRRRYIKYLLIFLSIMLSINIVGSIFLAFFSKFSIAVSSFFIVFCICNFMVLLGIIGSYIFQAGWENKDFLNILPGIVSNINKDNFGTSRDDDDDEMTLEEMLQGGK